MAAVEGIGRVADPQGEPSDALDAEWEYGVAPSASLDQVWPISEEGARATVRAEPGAWIALRRQRVVLPQWVPVEQEGAEQ